LLLDGGAPLLPHMHRIGIDPGAIDVVFLTHFHGDHTLGLPPFVLHRVFVDRRPLIFVGPPGIADHLEKLWEISWGEDWTRMKRHFKAKYVTAKRSGTVAGVKYESVRLDHGTMGGNGYRLHLDGRVLAYSGDSEPTAPLDELIDGADIAIVEATGPGDVVTHTSWEAAAELKKRHPKTRFLFNHVYAGSVPGAVKDLQVVQV
jgi:ribonuclease BN (tRNA processing enzyme)